MLTQSVDAGWQVQLRDMAERPLYQANQAGTVHTFTYDDLDRPVAIYESTLDSSNQPRVTERMVYGDALPNAEAQPHNLKGQLLRHYDLGGLRALTSFSLLGSPLTESRRLLVVENIENDWRGNAESDWQYLLLPGEDNAYITQWTYSALGETLTQTDAMGNRQRYSYLSTGQRKGNYLTPNGQAERVITHELEYNAAGLKLKETAGNGVSTVYTYDANSLQLSRTQVIRPTQTGRHSVLQDLRYRHDPVGNVLSIKDTSTATRFYKNQRVSASNQYQYDSLYQLTQATGRENDHILPQSGCLPETLIPALADTQQLRNYTRTYRYDRGGNLLRITHHPASGHGYTREMVISNRSNRAIAQVAGAPLHPEDVEEYFDEVGNLKALATGQPLSWDGQSQLRDATLVTRETGSDIERYRYSTQGVRLSKTTETVIDVASQRVKRETVIYLPGLELRQRWERKGSRSFFRSATLTEDLHVLVIGQSGAGTARMLHWAQGKPATIENDVLRYRVDSHLGSSALEFNQEADILTQEEYYPYGGTAVWSAKNQTEAKYRTARYSGKERDATGLYYYGYRYYQPWAGRWLNPDPAGTVDGLNLFRMVRNNPTTLHDGDGRAPLRRYPGTQTTFGSMGGVKFEKQSYLAKKNNSGLFELSDKGSGVHPIGLEGNIAQIYHQITDTHRNETIINTVDSFVNTSINGTAPPSRAIYARLEELSEYQNGATYLNPVGNSVKALFSGAVNLGIRTGLPTPEPILGTTPGTVGKASVGLAKSIARVAGNARGEAKGEASGNADELRNIRLMISNEKQDGMLYIGDGQVTFERVANRLFSSKGSTELSLIEHMSQQASQNPTYRKRAQREIASKLMDAVTIHH
ncbi:hypothetical protein L1D31_18075 [Vibrio sp. Isolate23]|uniref:RHS repeat-associated core domain-containing protein n=1 Tax=Vibrio sp. Isolate23 TaxID=2908533 RepID=UPI001EFEBA68|nr:RHS repeat-associated core domain-containing protein [Vibrio sp. Isolate23]MCG9684446.1 hypothetical protein [Vibrio sp. Isolate23]